MLGLSGTLVRLAEEFRRGPDLAVHLSDLQADASFSIVGARGRAKLPASGLLDELPTHLVEEALWWERHVLEVIYGVGPDALPGASARPGYDPLGTTLTQREAAKARELADAGHQVSVSRVKRQRQRYEAGGVRALVDRRLTKPASPAGRVDERVVAAMREAIAETAEASSRTAGHALWRTEQILASWHGPGAVAMPSRTTSYRLFARLSDTHTTGSARTRRSLAGRPEAPFGALAVDAPGEIVQIDSTPLDVLVLLDSGVIGRLELTGMIDVATRTVTAAVLSPTTKSVDASVLLARTVTPEPMRPGWIEALSMAHSVLPHRRLMAIDERLEHAAAKPVIVPDTIVCDLGKVFISHNFRASCRFLGITFQPVHPASGAEKPHIERMFSSVGTLFSQFVAGYTGSSVERRGYQVEDQPLWSQLELQALLDEWLILWQNRPHDGLRDPLAPGRAFTPNEKYAALVEAAGYVPIALGPEDYIELLPATWRAINAYGVRIGRRTYDAAALNPWRGQPSGVTHKRNLWEVHHDPYDVSRVWVREPRGGWINVPWRHLQRAPIPFGDLAWDHARANTPPGATEEQIADAVQDLLRRAAAGPGQTPQEGPAASKRERRVAARTKATARPQASPDPSPDRADQDEQDPQPLAEVIPMPIFDPFAEADKRW
ncbi:Mu transposase C-terminal domain-containing protein [Streptacidiphilus sp. PAMC 29251]